MPDVKRVIELVFSGQDSLSDKINDITKSFDKSQASIDKFAAPIAGATEKLLALEAAVVATGVALGVYAVTEAIKFEDAQTALEQVLGTTTRSMESFGDSALEMSNTFGISTETVLGSFAAFASAGFAAAEVEGLTGSILKYATASSVDATVATDALVRILKGFNLEAAETPAILDMVTAGADEYALNLEQLTEALARSAPIAALSNMTIAETTGVLIPMIEVFQSAEMASTAFNAVMQRLVSDNKNVAEGFDKLKVSQLDSTGAMRAGKDILLDVQKAFGQLDPSQKLVTANMLAGAEHAAKMVKVFDNLNLTSEATAFVLSRVGAAVDERLQKKVDDASFVLGRLATQFENAAKIAGGAFLKGIGESADGIGHLGLKLQELAKSEGFKQFAEAVGAQLKRAGDAVSNFSLALREALGKIDLTGFQAQLKLLGGEFEGLFTGIDLTTPEGLATAIQKIVDVGTKFLAFNRGVLEVGKPMIEILGGMFKAVSEMDPAWAKFLGTVAGAATAFTLLSPAISLASVAFGGFGKLIGVGSDWLKHVEKATAAAEGLGAKAVASFGAVAAAAAGGYAVGTLINTYLVDPLTEATTGYETLGEAAYAYVHGPAEAFSASAIKTRQEHLALEGTMIKMKDTLDLTGGAWQVAKGAVDGIGDTYNAVSKASMDLTALLAAQKSAVQSLHPEYDALLTRLQSVDTWIVDTGHTWIDATARVFELENSYLHLANQVDIAKSGFVAINGVWTQTTAASAGLAQTVDTVGEKAEKAAEKAAKLVQESKQLDLEWAKLESHNRELVFTASVDLQLAQVAADADKFKSIMESISKAIESTGSTLLGLAKLFVENQDFFKESNIERLLEEENERRKQSFELQKKMTESQLRYLDASTDRLRNGEALITIQAEGLEPELRAVLFRVVELAHIEASGAAGPLLLGLPVL